MRTTLTLTATLALAACLLLEPSTARANWNAKAKHYCTYWGSAGLFPDDEKALAANPLAKLKIPLRNGQQLEFPLLYIFKGYELDESPREWSTIWTGFSQACPGWPKPQWAQKLERWKAQNAPKGDPRIAKRKARIRALLASADSIEAKALAERNRVMASAAYQKITGGREDWKVAATAKKAFLSRIVSLRSTKYLVVGKVMQNQKEGAWVNGLSITPKPVVDAPGTRTTPTRLFVQTPKAGSVRSDGNFLSQGLYLLGLPTQKNPDLVFGRSISADRKKAIGAAAQELKVVTGNIKNGEAKLNAMMRSAVKLEGEAKRLRLLAEKLQSQNTGR